jgi:hypothetical protein
MVEAARVECGVDDGNDPVGVRLHDRFVDADDPLVEAQAVDVEQRCRDRCRFEP